MADNQSPDNYGNYQDNSGQLYRTLDNKPPEAYTPVKIIENGQTSEGVFIGGHVHKT